VYLAYPVYPVYLVSERHSAPHASAPQIALILAYATSAMEYTRAVISPSICCFSSANAVSVQQMLGIHGQMLVELHYTSIARAEGENSDLKRVEVRLLKDGESQSAGSIPCTRHSASRGVRSGSLSSRQGPNSVGKAAGRSSRRTRLVSASSASAPG
jgi:hypothetical protein